MADEAKPASTSVTDKGTREKGVRIFTYPKIIFIFPTLIMSLICWVGMWMITETSNTSDSIKVNQAQLKREARIDPNAQPGDKITSGPAVVIPSAGPMPLGDANPTRFRRPENRLGMIFLLVFFFNMLILAIDFPRFTILALVLVATTITFFLLWLGMFVRILEPLEHLFERVYVFGNAQFFFVMSLSLIVIYVIIGVSRWLDYWEIYPNEILHHHGPLSDLERYPTMNLKFDKEIPDVFEHMMFGAGRLVLHVSTEHKAIILDTVLHVSRKEEALKNLMSRMEVRVTTDQEVATT